MSADDTISVKEAIIAMVITAIATVAMAMATVAMATIVWRSRRTLRLLTEEILCL
jgi:hypothetical protein